MLVKVSFLGLLAVATATFEKTFIVKLAPESSLSGRSLGPHSAFHKRAESLEYTVRHEFNSPDTYLGLSLEVRSTGTTEEIKAQLRSIPGVVSVSQVQSVHLPIVFNTSADPLLSYSDPAPLKNFKSLETSGNLASPLQMGGIDKLHELGIKGKGIKIGIVDTGIDYRHPALGAGFGPGYKVAGGYAFVADNGTTIRDPDPLTTCYGGGHGTHVAGLIGMESVGAGFDIVGVAPEATLYAYKALDCNGHGGSDNIIAGMLQAQIDGVDIISMSIGGGGQPFNGDPDPYADVVNKLTDAGIAVIVAAANDVGRGIGTQALYTANSPSTVPDVIGVGAIANIDFPVAYSTVDSAGSTLKYASVWPIDRTEVDVYLMDSGCDSNSWNSALAAVTDVNNTIFAFPVGDNYANCQITYVGGWNSAKKDPVIIMGYNLPNTDKYWQTYDTPSQGFFGTTQWVNLNDVDGATFAANYAAAGGYLKYKLQFPSKDFESPQQPSGGFMDYYSDFGPTWHDFDLKPQISAPGGHTLSTWPLGVLGGYVILSGTSMATPYASGSFALVKSQFPHLKAPEILNLIQTTATPLPWIYDTTIVAATAQQGAGQINPYKAIFASSTVSPGQIKISDVNHRNYGTSKVVIKNASKNPKTYTLSHQGAGYTDYRLQHNENTQIPVYGNATFETTSITLAPGVSKSVALAVTPPSSNVFPERLPVFGGFINIADSDGESYNVPYVGPPYSLFNANYIHISNSGFILPDFYGHNATDGSIVYASDSGFIEVDPTLGWGYGVGTDQWTTEMRIDIVPANTKLKATNYGFDAKTVQPKYQASATTPNSSIFGQPSYGTILRQAGTSWTWPQGNSGSKTDTIVTADDGSNVAIGNGDVRFFASVLRQGGTSGTKDDYETYLGPIIRFVNAS